MAQCGRGLMLGLLALCLAGCAESGSMFGDGTISLQGSSKAAQSRGEAQAKYAATVRLLPYADERNVGNPRMIGTGGENIYGLGAPKGKEILLDQDVALAVTLAMKKRLEDSGYQVVDTGNAHFELGGVVRELTYNVKARDEVAIKLESTLKDSATGKVLWSGIVAENADRFAGVSGNDKTDVANYLKKELGIVTKKTNDAINAIVMAQRPELFNLIPGTKPIAGVTVLNAPIYEAASAIPVTPAVMMPTAAALGVLTIATVPSGAKIYVDDVYYGLSPLRLELDPGVRNVTVKLDGYKKAVEKVAVRKGDVIPVELKLRR